MSDHSECVTGLTDKNAAAACAYAAHITEESRTSDCWYPYFDEISELLRHKNSLVRNRAIEILAAKEDKR